MAHILLGKTGLSVEKNAFGCLPIQRIGKEEAAYLLRKAADGGMNYFDTARGYSDSEAKMGYAFQGMRDRIFLASKSMARTGEAMMKELETSLRELGTDYIDVYQFHNPPFCPKPGGKDGLYDAALKAREQGKIRFISITNHRLAVAREAVESGLYATLQFPYSYLSGPQEEALIESCRAAGMGFIAMKGMAGGLIRNGMAAAAFMAGQPGVVPIWGIQQEWELDQFLACVRETPAMTEEYRAAIEKDRAELSGEFCRGCGYCMPCPAGIEISLCARIVPMMGRMPADSWDTDEVRAKLEKSKECLHCGRCTSKCPYGLDTPRLLEENYREYYRNLPEMTAKK